MIKKLLVVSCIVLSSNLFGAQSPKISPGNTPLLFQFLTGQKSIRISALTQSWVEVDACLMERAIRSIDLVKMAALQSKKTCSYVLDGYGRVCKYNAKNKHKNYFLQDVLVLKSIANTQHVSPRTSFPSIQKGPFQIQKIPLQGKGLGK